ncbi:MAG: right-handed parallel beta-helix repeat-containing protein [Spirochaetes bacterium]|nr:right-handed parallel beta-helix repeat-containing protein [Spirochaetota bacterium]
MKTAVYAGISFALAAFLYTTDVNPPKSDVPAGGESVLPQDWRADMLRDWKTDASIGSIEAVGDGLKLITLKKPEQVYSLQARLLNQTAVKKNDVMLIRFAARSVKAEAATGATRLRVSFGKASAPWTRAHQSELGLTERWQRFDIPFKCPVDFEAKEAQFTFTFGYTPQEVEVTDISLMNYGSAVALDTLPKTQRYADAVPAAIVDREFARIADMKKDLWTSKEIPFPGKTIYVSAKGNASGDGTKANPFPSIPKALGVTEPGDTVLVDEGEYRDPNGISIKKSGRPDAWIRLKAAPGTRPKLISSGWGGINIAYGIAYIEIDGFELIWVADPSTAVGAPASGVHGVGIAPAYAVHHIRMLNNVIHDFGTGGICALDCDYLHLEGNVIYNTAHTSPYGGSGISLCRAFNFDEAPGYHNVVRRNICYSNENRVIVQVESGGTGHTLTDGNGIIIDVFKRSRKNPLKKHSDDKNGPLEAYRGRTLVENNLCYNNGGRGVHIFRSEKVDVINNTCYMNQRTGEINGGEFTAIEASDVVIANNIGYGRKGKRVSGQEGSTGFVIWTHNLLFGEDALIHADGIYDDPKFAAPAVDAQPEGFRLTAESPARGKGIPLIAPEDDVRGNPRQSGSIDLGAFQLPR